MVRSRSTRLSAGDGRDGRTRLVGRQAGVGPDVDGREGGPSEGRSCSDGVSSSADIRRYYDESAPKYDKRVSRFERVLFGGAREWVCSQAQGDVLEIAVGTGRNLRHYPPEVRLTGIELSPAMLELARQEAAALGREADLRVGDAE